MLSKPSPTLVALAVIGVLFMLYNFYRAWFRLEDTRANMQRMLQDTPLNNRWSGFFRRRLENPNWEREMKITSLINLVLMVIIAGIVFYAALTN
jgi:hypothetical protein